jgi:hypothetical protein
VRRAGGEGKDLKQDSDALVFFSEENIICKLAFLVFII